MTYLKIIGLFFIVLTFQHCSKFETVNTKDSSVGASHLPDAPILNPLPGVEDTFVPDDVGNNSFDDKFSQAFVQQGLISQTNLMAITSLRGAVGVTSDRPNPQNNTCSQYPTMDFSPTSRPNDVCRGYYESKNSNVDQQQKEIYVFSMYNATGESHRLIGQRDMVNMPIVIPRGKKPIELYLHAYEPTAWKLLGDVNRVKVVRTFGYHCQMVNGASSQTELYLSSAEQGTNELHDFLEKINEEKSNEFFSILLRIYVGSDLSRFVTSYNRECLGDFVAAP